MGRTIWRFALAPDGTLADRRAFVRFTEAEGYPDGMTVDLDDHLWVAHWGAGAVSRFRPDGSLERRIALPATQVTCPAFGGPEMKTLFVTSASIGIADAGTREKLAGALFAIEVGIVGQPAQFFAG